MLLNQRALQLLDIAKAIGPNGHRASSRKGRLQYNKFKQAVYFLEKDWEKVKVAYKQRGIRRRARTQGPCAMHRALTRFGVAVRIGGASRKWRSSSAE